MFNLISSWVINIIKFYEVYCDVEPKRRALEEANAELADAQETLANVKAKVSCQLNPVLTPLSSSLLHRLKTWKPLWPNSPTITKKR